ncbi:SusC/RagA family TonB-linked outer membrane protein [Mariniflexile sp. AS56]|uniref:SusC/RagA family TonB-linked outer membrane protein n=1 Tax=Mariniflexile sp. AS56 TaxID=3063957 RepID=UPI0026EA1625|nr:TonB-dependent receptor [Mariniflexile sp. AS56]MDO7173169.1 TonB-dependent receptor [Mariniflexile sp. AS56]
MKLNKLKTKKRLLSHYVLMLFFTLFCTTVTVHAQNSEITGVVTGVDDGMPIPGATVLKVGAKTGAVTNFDGEYSINAKIGDVLQFSYLGMVPQTVIVTQAKLNVKLQSDLQDLDEVVVVGYGTVKKKEITGAVAQLKNDDIEQFVTSDLASSMQGQIAGVSISASSGEPGEASDIQIRGITSLSGSNTPLFVVNGIPQIGDPGLSSNEIETIDVLKDAASTAVYGARGAAGVILITTKQGVAGQMKVDFNYTFGLQTLGDGTPLMNTRDNLFYETNRNEHSNVSFVPLIERYPEWINNDNTFDDYVLNRNAEVKTYNLIVSGGADKITYSIVAGLFDQDGSIINSNFKRYNGRASTTYTTDNWNIEGSLAFTLENRKRSSEGLIVLASRYRPYFPLIDPSEDQSDIIDNGGIRTPSVALNEALRRQDNSNSDRINASLKLDRKLSESLNFITRVGTSISNDLRKLFRPAFVLYDIEQDITEVDNTRNGVANISSRTTKFSWDASLNFKKQFGDHNLAATGIIALEEDSYEAFDASIQGVTNNNIFVLDIGSVNPAVNSGFNPILPSNTDNYNKKTVGTLARLQYNYKGRYLLSGLVRYDGSSRFGKEYRWGTFPSVSAAWNISDEPFWKPIKSTVNNFKLRLSHGTVGNDSFSDYEFASTISNQFSNYLFDENDAEESFGAAILSYANSNVKWETSVSNNVGLDISFLKNKFRVTADYYITKKRDMLFPITLPGSAGAIYDNQLTLNVGDMENKGAELAINYRANIGKSKLSIGTTFTTNENKITRIQEGVGFIPNQGRLVNGDNYITALVQGYEAGAFWLYETNGVVQTDEQLAAYTALENRETAQKGDLMYVDTNDDGKITDADRSYKGSGLPDFEYGLNLNWNIGSFDLSMNWFGTVGSEILNGNKADTYNFERHQDLVNMWTPNNPTSQIPLFRGAGNDHPNYSGTTDFWLENGDYLRLKQITLGYSLPKDTMSNLGVTNFRLFLSAQNALTFTKYSGYDPEIGGGNVARRGIDSSRYPIAALYSLGFKIDF